MLVSLPHKDHGSVGYVPPWVRPRPTGTVRPATTCPLLATAQRHIADICPRRYGQGRGRARRRPTDPAGGGNLALRRPTSESSHTQTYASGNAVDGDANSYWESANNAFPQWWQADLGAATSVGRPVLKLPPATAWAARTQTIQVQGSTDGSSFATLVAATGCLLDPASGNAVTVRFTATATRYLRLTVTANTGWPAGQLSEVEVYAS